ncbi:MAG TPA: DUF1269 domain-containing protein [Polyangia bacterium]|jgi:hypothetical protein|nr:DUF1269 domain-containing protein [Polyangia bacterium]
MQICILGFKGSQAADDAYTEVLELEGENNRWLLEVGVIARPRVGRVRVGVTFPDGEATTFHEGDLAKVAPDLGGLTGYYVSALAGPFGAMFAAADGETAGRSLGSDAEQRVFHLDDVKKALPRDSSALVLIANDKTCDALVAMFDSYDPLVIRATVEPELRARLEALERRLQKVTPAERVPMGL